MKQMIKIGAIFDPERREYDHRTLCPFKEFKMCEGVYCSKFITVSQYCDVWCEKEECDDCLEFYRDSEEDFGFCSL